MRFASFEFRADVLCFESGFSAEIDPEIELSGLPTDWHWKA